MVLPGTEGSGGDNPGGYTEGEMSDRENNLVEALERMERRAEAAEREVARLRDMIVPGDAAAYEDGMAAMQAKIAALEAEVDRLNGAKP